MKKLICSFALIAIIALSAAWTGVKLCGQRSPRPVAGVFQRSKVDGSGHTRGVVQVDLMRQIMADTGRPKMPAVATERKARHLVSTQDHPLLGRPAPALVLADTWGKSWNLGTEVRDGPIVIVFYLGSTCMACVTHLTELDVDIARFRERGVRVMAVSGDTPEFSLERIHNYGGVQIPLLSDSEHAVSAAYGVWKPVPGGKPGEGKELHGTFIVDRDGYVRWVHVSDRPFTDIEALLSELDAIAERSDRGR